jgi:hypothetical protein
MSVLLHRREIARAVLGELDAASEERLRAHLRGCDACRAHYDRLAGAASAVSGGAGAAARERARLFAALDAPAGAAAADPAARPAAAPGKRGRAWLTAGLVLAPVAALVLWFTVGSSGLEGGDAVTMRGGKATETRGFPAMLVVYASQKLGPNSHGPLRMAGELPGSGEVRVSLGDYMQLGVRGVRTAAHVRIVGVDGNGTLHDYVRDTPVTPSDGAVPLGSSVDLGRDHAAGPLRVLALFSNAKVDEQAVRDAVARLQPGRADPAADAYAGVVSGLVVIEP